MPTIFLLLLFGAFLLWTFSFWSFDSDDSHSDTISADESSSPEHSSPEAEELALERQRMKPYEDLRIIDGHLYRADAYEAIVVRLAERNCTEGTQKLVDMAAFSKGKLRGVTAYKILMDVEKEMRGLPKRDCAEVFASYILLNGGG